LIVYSLIIIVIIGDNYAPFLDATEVSATATATEVFAPTAIIATDASPIEVSVLPAKDAKEDEEDKDTEKTEDTDEDEEDKAPFHDTSEVSATDVSATASALDASSTDIHVVLLFPDEEEKEEEEELSDEDEEDKDTEKTEDGKADKFDEVYEVEPFIKKGGHLHGIYYFIYGGGPEGGYVIVGEYDPETFEITDDMPALYKVSRDWFKPWSWKLMPKQKAYYRYPNENYYNGGMYINIMISSHSCYNSYYNIGITICPWNVNDFEDMDNVIQLTNMPRTNEVYAPVATDAKATATGEDSDDNEDKDSDDEDDETYVDGEESDDEDEDSDDEDEDEDSDDEM
jgi:hypothetical protein